jgi:uncharacterized protein YaaR (DUF327 family)
MATEKFYQINFLIHTEKTSAFMEMQKILNQCGVSEIAIKSLPDKVEFKSTEYARKIYDPKSPRLNKRFIGYIEKYDQDKFKLYFEAYDEAFISKIGSLVKKAFEKKDIQLVNQWHQQFFQGLKKQFLPYKMNFHFSGHTIGDKKIIYTVRVADKKGVYYNKTQIMQHHLQQLDVLDKIGVNPEGKDAIFDHSNLNFN